MNERLFTTLAAWLAHEPVVLATVGECAGATPRKPGARMLIAPSQCAYSVGGGMAEARVIAAARALLAAGSQSQTLAIDLRGGPDAAGICGGRMQVHLHRWHGADDQAEAARLAQSLAEGRPARLDAARGGGEQPLKPDPRLLIIGGGHCGTALAQIAALLDFDLWLYDDRDEPGIAKDCPGSTRLTGPANRLQQALATPRKVYAVLLNRDWQRDLDCLEALAASPPHWIGMMGSQRRIAHVRMALARHALPITAPVGLDIGAQTPHEIAVSILAQIVALRSNPQTST